MKKILPLVLYVLIYNNVCAQINTALIDSFMQAQVKYNRFNGNVLLAQNGNVVYQKSFGYRNYDTKEPLNEDTQFELASISKQFTAMGILLLEQQGKLKLTDSLRKFFPPLPYSNITVRHLLTHTSGIPDYNPLMDSLWDRSKIAFNEDLIRLLTTHKPAVRFSPGSRFEYNNTGYALLASIFEKVSGQSFGSYMQQQVFDPLIMSRTRTWNTRRSKGDASPNYAYGYMFDESSQRYMLPDSMIKYQRVYYMDGIQGDGVVNSTLSDLLKWDRALKKNKLLTPARQKQMFSPQMMIDSITDYGFGVRVSKHELGKLIWHGGVYPGYRTYLGRLAEDDLTVVVLSNNRSNAHNLGQLLLYIAKGEPVLFPYQHQEVAIDKKLIDRYTGQYQLGNTVLTLVNIDGQLVVRIKGSADAILKPESETKFFFTGRDQQIEFLPGATGEVEKAWLISSGLKEEIKKIK